MTAGLDKSSSETNLLQKLHELTQKFVKNHMQVDKYTARADDVELEEFFTTLHLFAIHSQSGQNPERLQEPHNKLSYLAAPKKPAVVASSKKNISESSDSEGSAVDDIDNDLRDILGSDSYKSTENEEELSYTRMF